MVSKVKATYTMLWAYMYVQCSRSRMAASEFSVQGI